MAKKVLGYTELEWTCPNCNSRNKGALKSCAGCGAAQPANVEFHEPIRQELIEDEQTLAKAKAGPDVHCAFCGVRNPAGTETCINCGANLAQGTKRETGNVIAAFVEKPETTIACPNCGHQNPDSALTCTTCGASIQSLNQKEQIQPIAAPKTSRKLPVWMIALIGLIAVGACLLIMSLFRTRDTAAQVTNRNWERIVVLEQFGPVQREEWRDQLPAEGMIITCQEKFRYESAEPVSGAEEVCATPYTVDEGSGFGKVVQDCIYRVYEDYCKYQINEWAGVNEVVLQGNNNSPDWLNPALNQDQRLGERTERYQIVFDADGASRTFTTSDLALYQQALIGSKWTLKVNSLGQIVDAEPIN